MPNKTLSLIIVLAIATLVLGPGAVSPALADIAKAFPDKSPETIQMVATLPSLLFMVSSLVCGHLSRKLGKRTLVMTGLILYGIGGIAPAFFGDLAFILVMRGVFGAGVGFIVPLSQALTADYFAEPDRSVYMGYGSSTASVFAMYFTMAGGYLCSIYWRYTFLSYLLVVPVFLLVMMKMPEPELQKPTVEHSRTSALTRRMWFYVTMYFLYNVIWMCFVTNAAFVMSVSKVGNANTIGLIMTISGFGGIVAGILLGWVTKVFKNFTLVLAVGFHALGFIMLLYVNSAIMFTLACAVFYFGFGIFNPAMSLKIIGSVPKSAITLALAILTCAMGVGQFISPMVYSFINNNLGVEGPRASWVVAAVCFTATFMISLAKVALRPQKVEAA